MKSMKTHIKCLWMSIFFQIFYFNGSSVIYLYFSEILVWNSSEAIRGKVQESDLIVCQNVNH
jgi:hypothetical protein